MIVKRIPSVLPQLRDESGLSYEKIARELDVTVGAVLGWKAKGHKIDSVVSLLNFAASRGYANSARKLARSLESACGSHVQVLVKVHK